MIAISRNLIISDLFIFLLTVKKMSLGANFSSGYTNQRIADTLRCSDKPVSNQACPSVMRNPSGQILASKKCAAVTPAEFAKYPKVAVASSIRTQKVIDTCTKTPIDSQRFSQYVRYQPPIPCPVTRQPTSLPSVNQCSIYFIQTN